MRIYRERSMLSMHLYLVCNMNKIARGLIVYILVLATTGAVEFKSVYKTSTTTANWKEPTSTTKWDQSTTAKPASTTEWKQPSTTKASSTTNWRQPITIKTSSTTSWKQPEPTKPTTWQQSTTKEVPRNPISSSHAAVKNGVFAVASISGVDSRNGRVSSMNGIKIFPSIDSAMVKTDDKGNFIFKSVDGKMPMPITITKDGDGVSGTIRILPGSVSVSSSASSSKSGPAAAVASYNPWPSPFMKPMINDIYFPPFPTFPSIPDPVFNTRLMEPSYHTRIPDPFAFMRMPEFHSRIQDPWFNKDRYKQAQAKSDMFKPSWYYPSFNPYINFW